MSLSLASTSNMTLSPSFQRKDADELRKRVLSNNMVKAILIGRVSADRPNSPDALSVHGVDEVVGLVPPILYDSLLLID